MTTASLPNPPALDKPGAGIPLHHWLALRLYIKPFYIGRSTWEENWQSFAGLHEKILHLVENLSSVQLEKQVLIKPLTTLEDSSRFWSIAMTLEHLVIVNEKIKAGILALSQNIVPSGKADTASVKPHGGKDGRLQLAEYKASVAALRPGLDPVRDAALNSQAKFAHPWFGPFTARQWQWLFGAHTYVHYQQIKEIAKGL